MVLMLDIRKPQVVETRPRYPRAVGGYVREGTGVLVAFSELVGGLVAMNFIFPEILGC